jgi:hypothetical protein
VDYGEQNYDSINKKKVETILKGLMTHGCKVSGDNPWTIDTQKHGVMLQGKWDEVAAVLTIAVTAADWYVPRKAVWENIDSLMQQIQDAG